MVLAGVSLVVRGYRPVVDYRVDQRSQIVVLVSQIRRSRRAQEIQQEKPIGFRVTCSLHGTRSIAEPCPQRGACIGVRQARTFEQRQHFT